MRAEFGLNLVRHVGFAMKLSERVKPISYLKANAPDVIRGLAEERQPLVITVNGEAKAVLQDIESYDQMQEALALMKILALSNDSVRKGKILPARDAFARARKRSKE